MDTTYSIASPPAAPGRRSDAHVTTGAEDLAASAGRGAIAIVEVRGDVAEALERLGIGRIEVGRFRLRSVPGVDTMVVARPSERIALLFPHGGPAVIRRVTSALERAGVRPARADEADPPEVGESTAFESRLHRALARAASPLGVDLLLEQPHRWAALHERGPAAVEPLPHSHGRILRRLIEPALVIALGPPNIGKSSLLNTLAGRDAAVVADQPGTTRDHVGVLINFAGVVAKFVDAPGIDAAATDPIQVEAQAIALTLARTADLVLWCGDAASGFLPDDALDPVDDQPRIRVALRADLGMPPGHAGPVASVRTGAGIADLVQAIRETLVPASLLDDPRPWRFWERGGR